MKAQLGWAGLLAALVVAGMPGASSAGWCPAFTAGYRSAYAPDGVAAGDRANEAGEAGGDSVFRLAFHHHSCGHCGYSSYYPGYSYYGAYSYYPGYSYYGGYSYYPGYSYACGCIPICGCYSGW